MPQHSLTLAWQMTSPPLAAQSWFAWREEELPPPQPPPPHKGYQLLGLDPQVGDLLRRAFQRGLGRGCGWDLTGVDPTLKKPLQQAAAIYKRGVSVAGQAPVAKQGFYEVRLKTLPPAAQLREVLGLPKKKGFFVLDAGLVRHWPHLRSQAHMLWEADERRKLLVAAAQIAEEWDRQGRPSPWVIVGGGVLADTAAFAASLCGCPFILMPTTLLAAVDACVGGKTGVNMPLFGKNQIGHFAFPEAVVVCPEFLQTLPPRQWAAGLAECVKHAMLATDPQLMTDLHKVAQEKTAAAVAPFLLPLISVKAVIVAEDPSEQGRRALLNLGHTLAHALESYSHAKQGEGEAILLHGEAVALGLRYALLLSRRSAHLSASAFERLLKGLDQSGCLLARSALESYLGASLADPALWPKLWTYMRRDKKQPSHEAADVSFVLLADHNRGGIFGHKVSAAEAEATWLELLESYH